QPLGTQFPIPTACGYPGTPQSIQYVWTTNGVAYALASAAAFGNSTNCGRCVDLVRTQSGSQPKHLIVTIVGGCTDPVCVANPNLPRFQIGPGAYGMLATANEPSLPSPQDPNETLRYSFVECPVPTGAAGTPESIRASVTYVNGAPASILFVGQRFGIMSASFENPTVGQRMPLARDNANVWLPPSGTTLGSGSPTFHLTDTNNREISFPFAVTTAPAFTSTGVQFLPCNVP
ncbi:MAG TPA: hypothetical protein VN903_08300, partial [Polyangia bacterium]|nr:hypothetical protein [Polyangia bacterium]